MPSGRAGAAGDPAIRPGADAIIVAAGASTRMAGADKLDARLAGRPLLAWTLLAVAAARGIERIVVVVSPDRLAAGTVPAPPAGPPVTMAAGGPHRGASVEAGLRALEALGGPDADDRVVVVHDGARPLVTPALVAAVIAAAAEHGAAIPVVPVAETLKRVEDGRVHATVDRTGLAAAQTPQGVRRRLLRKAFERFPPDGPDRFTDEAALLEACTIPVHAIPGDPVNLKVTVPADLERAAALLAARQPARVGLGRDAHPFGPLDGLRLGGLELAAAPRLHGHSDGDVALHAVADAMLGAAGLGDLGRLFPADRRTPEGVASTALLGEVRRRVEASGWRVESVDVTITGARPRLGEHLGAMAGAIAGLLGLAAEAVSVKASSGNLGDAAGAGRRLEAEAVAVLRPVGAP